ncbi:type I secretion system permease/ATPase [Ruegeria sp.]|uniref:type I secretion system permease/ATPase n=1 Tax=Ruegeria sp. TaxID=1879320 RepID=UPI003B00B6AE
MLVERCFRTLRQAFFGVGLISLPINLLMLTGPFFMLQIYDRVLASNSIPTLGVLAGLVIGLYAFYGLLEAIRSRVLLRIGQRFDTQLSAAGYECSVLLPVHAGRKAEGLDPVRDLEAARQFLAGPGPSAIFDIPWMPFYLGIIYIFHPVLGLIATGGGVVICILIGLNEAMSRKPAADMNHHALSRSRMVEQARRNAEAIAAMGMMGALKTSWDKDNGTFLQKQRRAADLTSFFGTCIKTFRFMLQSGVLGAGAWLAISQEITPGIMIAASILTSRALSPVEQAVGQWRGFLAARQGVRRLREALQNHPVEPRRLELPLPSKTLSLDAVMAGPESTPVLRNIGFALEAGDGLGVIGPSGAGKTTLARLLVGVYPALGGDVRLDGAYFHQWPRARRGTFIGYLPQNIQLFAGTIAQNIARFEAGAQAADIIEAARLADAHDLVTGLPDGYDTETGPDGKGLSGGQIQRIALARALYGNPFLVVLDEPNSNLDAAGEAALTNAIQTMRAAGSIVIVIAHRPSALAGVDLVLAMSHGRIVDFGAKREVLSRVLSHGTTSVRAV